jgi:hypothetical protein
MIWVRFNDMHSGGGLKEPPFECLYLRSSSEEQGIEDFARRFGHRPTDVGCNTCGDNYSIDADEDLRQLTAYSRELRFASPKAKPPNKKVTKWQRDSEAWKQGRYLEPGESIPKGWVVKDRWQTHDGITLREYLGRDDVFCDLESDLEYLARLEEPPVIR